MALFKKKTTLVHHISYMGIMTAINLIFVVLARYVPYLMFLLILLLPFASTIVSYFCLKRFFLIYAVASIGLCILFNPTDTLFYVVPAILSGFMIGVMLDKRAHPFWMVLSSTIINAALTFAFIPLINLISGSDIVNVFLTLFKLENFAFKTEVTYLFILFISLAQCLLTVFVLISDVKKMGIETNTRIDSFAPYIIGLEVSVLLSLIMGFFYAPLAFFFLGISLYFMAFVLIDLFLSKKPLVYILLVISVFVSIILFAIFYMQIAKPMGLILLLIFPTLISVLSFVKNYLLKQQSNI